MTMLSALLVTAAALLGLFTSAVYGAGPAPAGPAPGPGRVSRVVKPGPTIGAPRLGAARAASSASVPLNATGATSTLSSTAAVPPAPTMMVFPPTPGAAFGAGPNIASAPAAGVTAGTGQTVIVQHGSNFAVEPVMTPRTAPVQPGTQTAAPQVTPSSAPAQGTIIIQRGTSITAGTLPPSGALVQTSPGVFVIVH